MVDERELEGRKAQALCHITPGQTPAIAEGADSPRVSTATVQVLATDSSTILP